MIKKLDKMIEDTRGLVGTVSFIVHTQGGDDADVANVLRHYADGYLSRAGLRPLSALDELIGPRDE